MEFCRFAQQAGTEVQHQDGAAQNVFVVSLPHKLQLRETDKEQRCLQTEGEGGLFETLGEGNASEHRPSYRPPNLFERSG